MLSDGPNTYGYAGQRPGVFVDEEGLISWDGGHHPIIQFVRDDRRVSSEASKFWGGRTTGSIFDINSTTGKKENFHKWSKEHDRYNKAVRNLFEDFCERNKVDLNNKVSLPLARQFYKEVLTSANPDIRNFNRQQFGRALRTLRLYRD